MCADPKSQVPPIFALLTDFGTKDHYVAAMKGVLLSDCPNAQIVDVTHEVQPQDVLEGAYLLDCVYPHLPPGTVCVAVVDPGVGSDRPGLVARIAGRLVVAPDNGLVGYVWSRYGAEDAVCYHIDEAAFRRAGVSATFHGRDVFAPVAVRLARQEPLSALGPAVPEPVLLPTQAPKRRGRALVGQVVHVDRFGNAVSNITEDALTRWLRGLRAKRRDVCVIAGGAAIRGLRRFYAEVPAGEALALIGSGGYLEVAVNGGSAAELLSLKRRDTLALHLPAPMARRRPGGRAASAPWSRLRWW